MNKIEKLNFVANAGLKDIVGRDLITNKNLALIELIKNSKDADSEQVDLLFIDSNDTKNKNAKIIIRDFGLGMSFDDIKNKWLNIAYSSKKHSVNSKGKAYAGNKGVGRFSCDRLGEKLELYTISSNGMGYKVSINWCEYETENIYLQISDPKVIVEEINIDILKKIFETDNIKTGTCLIISNLRDNWDTKELLNLKKELEKFVITPNSEIGSEKFDVNLYANFLNTKDSEIINGKIQNKIFQQLNFRTASITAEISSDGSQITTTLFHDGRDILTIIEKNLYTELKNIKTKLFYMGRAQRIFFSRKIGYSSLDFGSIFLFLNGFRIYPYGEESNDWLKLDQRKAQGYNRFLGTRELMGYISIEDNENKFKPVSAREGLLNNQAFLQLSLLEQTNENFGYGFMSKVVRKFEKFVVDGLNWDRLTNEQIKDEKNLNEETAEFVDVNKQLLSSLSSLINFGIKKENLISVNFNIDYFDEMSRKELEACQNFYNELKTKIDISSIKNIEDLNKLLPKIKKEIDKKDEIINQQRQNLVVIENALLVAEQEKQKEVEEKRKVEKENRQHKKTIQQITSENFFLRTTSNQDLDDILDCMHTISTAMDTIENERSYFLENNQLSQSMLEFLEYIDEPLNKIKNIAKYAILKNYKDKENPINADLITFIKKHIEEIKRYKSNQKIQIVNNLPEKYSINLEFIPLQIMTLVDNIISNAKKATKNVDSPQLTISVEKKSKATIIIFEDNGVGLSNKIKNIESIFEKGVTTTHGAGLGLYQVKKTIHGLNGQVVAKKIALGFRLEIIFNEN